MPTQVIMPKIGESVVEGTVSRWLKQEGERIAEFDLIVEVETDKVTSEVPAPAAGLLLKILVPEGTTVDAGTVLALIGEADEAPADEVPAPVVKVPVPQAVPVAAQPVNGSGVPTAQRISPVVARIAAEHHLDVSRIPGTGRGGRVTKQDILAYVESGASATPAAAVEEIPPWEQPVEGDLFKPTEEVFRNAQAAAGQATQPEPSAPPAPPSAAAGDLLPLTTMRRRIAEHMVHSKLHTSPHVATVFEADMSAVAAHRAAHQDDFARRGLRLTYTAYFVAAVAAALQKHPRINSQWSADGILLMREINIGMAVALDEGLIVPVIRRADEYTLAGLARQVNALAAQARAGTLSADDLQGGTFTVTNHGTSGSLFATPIINQPQAGILGIGAVQKRVVVLENDAIAARPMVYLSFSFDHRVFDGAVADAFVAEVKHILESWR